ncbi:uncharacterized protein LOC127751333 [Frankliniella occidentalis]|uniref:Uncharacterized protein LOC127751333 n=1 Tax=Frankliniella occidentalis TaxID=133901 RepID=A0A9C6XTR5_FRAOC|nr:uncharacterized protein LOC127751333 [Frankliniella occidentalis]
MTLLTRTGLLEGRRRHVARRANKCQPRHLTVSCSFQPPQSRAGAAAPGLAVEPLCQAAPYSLRPLAALLNPYARGCSVLCNHPADTQSRDALRRVKETWPTERVLAGEDALPEELFRRYTDTDSRPHSPPGVGARHSRGPGPPLLAPPPSGATVAGAGQRRCRTPDPYHPHTYLHHPAELQQQQQPGQPQRTLLVLDLRRSRSHDTLSVAAAVRDRRPCLLGAQ